MSVQNGERAYEDLQPKCILYTKRSKSFCVQCKAADELVFEK